MKIANLVFHVLFLMALGFLFNDELYSLALSWIRDSNYQHGFFVLAMSIFLILYQFKKEPRNLTTGWADKENWKKNFVVLVLIVCFYFAGFYYGISYLNLITFLLCLKFWSVFLVGRQSTHIFNFPLFYIFLVLPLPGLAYFTIYLQRYTAKYVSVFMLKFDHYFAPGYYQMWDEGNFLHLPNFSFEIVPECTGIHSFLTLLALMVLFLYFLNLKKYQKVMVGLFCVPISFVGNFLRILTLVFIAFGLGQEAALKFWHYFGGFFFFAISLGLEFLIIALFQLLNKLSKNK